MRAQGADHTSSHQLLNRRASEAGAMAMPGHRDRRMWCARRAAGSPPIQSRAVAKKAQDGKIAGYFIFPACVHIKTDV